MKITKKELRKLISESMEGVPERDEFMINLLIQNISSLANAMPEEIDEGLTGSFMDIHISTFKNLEKEGLLNHFTAYDKGTFYPEVITLYFLYDHDHYLNSAINRALYKFFTTSPNITGHRGVDYVYTKSGSGRGDAIVTYHHHLDYMTIHIAKPGHDTMKA